MPSPAGLALEQLGGLPREQLVGQPLEALADHHEPAGPRVARAEVEVRQPPLPAPVAPLRAEHDEVVGAHRLHLAPRLAAPAGGVERLASFTTTPSCPAASASSRTRSPSCGVGGDDAAGSSAPARPPRAAPGAPRAACRAGPRRRRAARRRGTSRTLRRRVGVDLGHRSWNAAGPPSPIHSASPSRTACSTGERAHRVGDPRQRAGDLVQVARVDAHLVAAAVDLDPDPVELPLDRCAVEARHRLLDALRRRGEHRQDRPEDLEADARRPCSPVGHRDLGGPRQVAGEHQCPARDSARARRPPSRPRRPSAPRARPAAARP